MHEEFQTIKDIRLEIYLRISHYEKLQIPASSGKTTQILKKGTADE